MSVVVLLELGGELVAISHPELTLTARSSTGMDRIPGSEVREHDVTTEQVTAPEVDGVVMATVAR